MTSERRGFPVVLSIATLAVLMVLLGLGAWQLQRLAWKTRELRKIERLQSAAPQPIGPVLAQAAAGADVELARVAVRCLPAPPAPARLRMTTDAGAWIARALSGCRIAGGPYAGVLADRGFLAASRGMTAPTAPVLPAPAALTGVLFRPAPIDGPVPAGFAPYLLSVETERPPAPGVTPAPYDVRSGDSLQYVGAYAPTWFGLAGVLVCVYAALLWRRLHPRA